jgi:iron(III)-enterobactin esterase
MIRLLNITLLISLMTGLDPAMAQAPAAAPRPAPPTRDPHTPGYVAAKELPDGANAPAREDGNFILGPTHNPARELAAQEGAERRRFQLHHGIGRQ